MKRKTCLMMLMCVFLLCSCDLFDSKEDEPNELGGTPAEMGGKGETFSADVVGVADAGAEVISRTNEVSTIKFSGKITNNAYLQVARAIPEAEVSDDGTVTITRDYKITDEGFQDIYDGVKHTIVKYDSEVGDKYVATRNGKTITREVSYKSTSDDYELAFWKIKVIKVKETGNGLPGISTIEYVANHKWGVVGVDVTFEDGSTLHIGVLSAWVRDNV